MRAFSNIDTTPHFDLKRLSVYKQAIDLFTLSRKLSNSNPHTSILHCPIKGELATTLSSSITSSALSLPLSIAEASVTADFAKKMHFKKSIEERIAGIVNLSTRLEQLLQHRDERVKHVISSASALQAGLKKWSTHLTLQN